MPPTDHLSHQFDADLEDIRSRVLQMGGFVEAQIQGAIEAFSSGDDDISTRVIDSERRVNEY